MNKCIKCKKKTNNPKFCSSSCSASYHNKGKRRHGNGPNICLKCKNKTANSRRKFCSHKCSVSYRNNQKQIDVDQKLKNGDYVAIAAIRRFLIFKNPNCWICNQLPIWNNKPLSMQCDHIDGNCDNNHISNLRILCPNCHTQTETWCARNKPNTERSKYRRQWRKDKQSLRQEA